MTNKLQILQEQKTNFVKKNNERFDEKQGARIKKEYELILKNKEKEKIENELKNEEIDRKNIIKAMLGILSFLFIGLIFVDFIYDVYDLGNLEDKNISQNGVGVIMLILLFAFAIIGYLTSALFFEEKISKRDSQIEELNIEKEKNIYFKTVKCSLGDIKDNYKILKEHLGEDQLNEKVQTLMKEDEELGSYFLILRLFDDTINDLIDEQKKEFTKVQLNKITE